MRRDLSSQLRDTVRDTIRIIYTGNGPRPRARRRDPC
jgi:hypothetical protein